ncbi:MAG: tRNA uridine-5-carboxymethylaminomethyl(34) synthesis GTPase MnmE [Candidatus Omnitrophota bacterium]
MNTFKLKDYNTKDTIAAIATFPSASAIGIVRLSGKNSLPIVYNIFKPRRKKDIRKVNTYTLHYGWIVAETRGQRSDGYTHSANRKPHSEIIDEVIISVMKAPNSYTREDVVEISSHGGTLVLNKILEVILKQGARLALPGEFTYRAFVKGRIDIFQAESVFDIIQAKSQESLNLALKQLRGFNSKMMACLKDKLAELFSKTEAILNFPEDEVNSSNKDIEAGIKELIGHYGGIAKAARDAKILKEGLKCVICGRTNAGKSTLFNRLLKEERVIVSKSAGTTRDVIEETIYIKGNALRIYDTAGILEPKDLIAKKAIKKTVDIFNESDLVIFVLDGSKRLNKDDLFLLGKVKNRNSIIVINKADLPGKVERRRIRNLLGASSGMFRIIHLSALRDLGIKKLENAVSYIAGRQDINRHNMIFLSKYQEQVLAEILRNLKKAEQYLKEGYTYDFINLSLRSALDSTGKLAGHVFSEDMLDGIFSKFCIGK